MAAYSLQQALVSTPLVVLRPRFSTEAEDRKLLVSLSTVSVIFIMLAACFMWGTVTMVSKDTSWTLPLSASAFVAGTLNREYVRSLLFSEMDVRTVLVTDMGYVGLATLLGVFVWSMRNELSLSVVLLSLGVASGVASVLMVRERLSTFAISFDRVILQTAADIFRKHSRWTLAGVAVYELTTRVHLFVVSAIFGLTSVAVIQAGEMMFRPLTFVTQAWTKISVPSFARFAAENNVSASRNLLIWSVFGGVLGSLLFIGALWLAWPLLKNSVFRDAYVGIELAVVLWAIAASLRICCEVLGAKLQGEARFRELSAIGGVSSIVCMGVLTLTISIADFEWVIAAIIVRNIAEILLMTGSIFEVFLSHGLGGRGTG